MSLLSLLFSSLNMLTFQRVPALLRPPPALLPEWDLSELGIVLPLDFIIIVVAIVLFVCLFRRAGADTH